jgi:alkyldihydroxyacetonephosphate synthase
MVTPRGLWESRRLPASGAGPSPDRLALGSEGILGIITEAWMRVRPRPRWRASASMRFRDFAAAVAAARDLAQSDLYPTNCRLLDAREALIHRVVMDGSSVLLVGFESADHPLEPWMNRALEIARARGGVGEPSFADAGESAGRAEAAGAWRASFLDAPYLFNTLVSLGMVVDTFETACTWDRFDALHAAVGAAVGQAMRAECGGGILSCRFTHVYPDGPAPYYSFHAKGDRKALLKQWLTIKKAASDAVIANGGTITHHHAVGRDHMKWYERQRPKLFGAALKAAKSVLDPAGVMNPGVIVR